MGTDFAALLRGDHGELGRALRAILAPSSTEAECRSALDGLRLGFAAHAEGESTVLREALDRSQAPSTLYFLVAQTFAAHLAQETALAALADARPGTTAWHDRGVYLRELVRHHAEHEEACVLPALRDHLPRGEFAALAGAYATERLRALTHLQPASFEAARIMRL